LNSAQTAVIVPVVSCGRRTTGCVCCARSSALLARERAHGLPAFNSSGLWIDEKFVISDFDTDNQNNFIADFLIDNIFAFSIR
jgi:hypothetical protein